MYLKFSELTKQLESRFNREFIYTNISEVLISVNPFKYLPITGPEHIEMYKNSSGGDAPPHVFQLAERAYRRLIDLNESQAVIISGESGAGMFFFSSYFSFLIFYSFYFLFTIHTHISFPFFLFGLIYS